MEDFGYINSLADSFWHDPLFYVGIPVAFLAAIAFLTFLRGFLSGFPHFITLSSHEEHQKHHREHVERGTMMLVALFVGWELLRGVVLWITGLFN